MAKKKKSDDEDDGVVQEHPSTWRARFQGATLRTSFCLALSQPMLEMLCAVADGVCYDRALYFCGSAKPDNFIASSKALEKRGLIQDHPERQKLHTDEEIREGLQHIWKLTPAGEALVQLLRVTGVFIEADAAIQKKAKKVAVTK